MCEAKGFCGEGLGRGVQGGGGWGGEEGREGWVFWWDEDKGKVRDFGRFWKDWNWVCYLTRVYWISRSSSVLLLFFWKFIIVFLWWIISSLWYSGSITWLHLLSMLRLLNSLSPILVQLKYILNLNDKYWMRNKIFI